MNVISIRLINFRNYDDFELILNEKMNVFIGKNAQGKTNLLESIYMCANGRSFRTNRDGEIINLDRGAAYIGGKFQIDGIEKIIEIKLDRNRPKRIKINHLELQNLRELDSGLSVVIFCPDDLKLIKGGPRERRTFLDNSISQIRPVYGYNINKYNRILLQRNNLLRGNRSKSSVMNLIDVFDIQLARIGADIILSRLNFIDEISIIAKSIHSRLAKEEKLTIKYGTNVDPYDKDRDELEEEFLNELKDNIVKDMDTGITSLGPHRDNMIINVNGIDSRVFASQGQQRTIVLSLKLSEMEIIKRRRGMYPILLLDDVFSELDRDRRRYLMGLFNNVQTIITSTDINYIDELKDIEKSIFYIENGKIIE